MPTARLKSAGQADPIGQFFEELGRHGHLATFNGRSATLRFEVADDARPDHWLVTVTRGDVSVSRQHAQADAVVRLRRPDFEAMVTGRLNAQAAILRGVLTCAGSMAALVMFQRCLPGPPGATGRVAPISSATVTQERRGQ